MERTLLDYPSTWNLSYVDYVIERYGKRLESTTATPIIHKTRAAGFIYVIRSKDKGTCKIGHTYGRLTRARQIQKSMSRLTGHSGMIVVFTEGTIAQENELHSRFESFRIDPCTTVEARTEWYRCADEVKTWISRNAINAYAASWD